MRRVCVPERYWLTTRPVVRWTGKVAVHGIAGRAIHSVTRKRALPSGWKKRPPSKSRGVPGWSFVGQGQKTPISRSIFS